MRERERAKMNGKSEEEEEEIGKRVAALVQQAKVLQSASSSLSTRLRIEEQSLGQQALALEKDFKRLRADAFSALEKDGISPQLAEKIEEDMERAHGMICEGDVGALLPHKYNGLFLKMLLGPVNVKAARTDARFKAKEEYNAYRDRTALLFLLFPLTLLLLKNRFWQGCFPALPVQAYQAWLLFFYTSLAFRENILRINGSNIRPWMHIEEAKEPRTSLWSTCTYIDLRWVYHHYCAMLMAVVALTWDIRGPECEQKQCGVLFFLVWAVMQGVAMLLQNRYQRQRLYTRIALGKAGRMDVVSGETSGVRGQLRLLYPLLFLLQVAQCCLGILLLYTAFTNNSQWQVLGCGILLLVMGAGNFCNTMETVYAKKRVKSRMKNKNLLQNQ